ncbi:hypothetical protein CDV31_016852 [Fusarium ambrosium]|uniref:NAD(P)-binding domain-containing protein n=1 Tax=Fusarium ambrosium TaxID=131363 RepID=A0A428S0H4_9HYPO|nr:hypothetical protein CDV31_016852 [Fusarium ambrosium]
MKVVITGSTGLIGSAVIRECITNDEVTHAFILSRQELPDEITRHAKITVIIHTDFSTYPSDLLQRLAGCEACIWAIGGRAPQFPDIATYRKVQVDYPLTAAHEFEKYLAPGLLSNKSFRFIFCSGKYAEWDQEKSLSFMADTRLIKGQVEKGLCDIAKKGNRFNVWCARPSGVLSSNAGIFESLMGKLYGAIKVNDLARALVQIALNGNQKQIIESDELPRI